jgi:16S rRNA processing protein RimM
MPAPAKLVRRKKVPGSPSLEGGPSFLTVARVRRPFGVRGELLLAVQTDFPQRLLAAEEIYCGEEHVKETVATIRRHGQDMLLKLESVGDRDGAERFRNLIISVRMDDLPPLPPGTYYHYQIEGLSVVTENGEVLGTIHEILKTGANDVYVVRGPNGEILLPAIPQVILVVRLDAGTIVVRLMDGLEWRKLTAAEEQIP